jgi:hypothetical protein
MVSGGAIIKLIILLNNPVGCKEAVRICTSTVSKDRSWS